MIFFNKVYHPFNESKTRKEGARIERQAEEEGRKGEKEAREKGE